jgi:hypothetical protein
MATSEPTVGPQQFADEGTINLWAPMPFVCPCSYLVLVPAYLYRPLYHLLHKIPAKFHPLTFFILSLFSSSHFFHPLTFHPLTEEWGENRETHVGLISLLGNFTPSAQRNCFVPTITVTKSKHLRIVIVTICSVWANLL